MEPAQRLKKVTISFFSIDADAGNLSIVHLKKIKQRFELLPQKFTLRQLQQMYAKILDRDIDKRNFRKKIIKMGILEELDEIETDVAHRAARLYKFNKEKYDDMVKRGFNFEI